MKIDNLTAIWYDKFRDILEMRQLHGATGNSESGSKKVYTGDGGKSSELLCFAEYNSERAEGAQICIGTYVSDEDETQYYAPYMAERNNEP